MHLSACGSSLVSYACYTNDLHSIFELDLPWTKSCLASILFTRIYKGFEPFPRVLAPRRRRGGRQLFGGVFATLSGWHWQDQGEDQTVADV